MKFTPIKGFLLVVMLALFSVLVSVVAADDDKQKGPFTLTAEATGDTDTFEIILTEADLDDDDDDDADDFDDAKLDIKLKIKDSQGDWELELKGPDGEDLGSMSSASGDNHFKVQIKGEVKAGVYTFTFTNTGTDLAQISGDYDVKFNDKDDDDDDRYFFDAGAKIAIYIIKVEVSYIINIWGIDADGAGYEAIVISLEDIYEIVREKLKLDITVVIDVDDLDLEENLLLTTSKDGKIKLYLLTTGEFQVNVGPFEDGTVQVFIYDNFPPTRVYRKDFNVYTLLQIFESQTVIDDDADDDSDDD